MTTTRLTGTLVTAVLGAALVAGGCARSMGGGDAMMTSDTMKKDDGMMNKDGATMEKK